MIKEANMNLYKKLPFSRQTKLFMIAFERKYGVNVYHSVMSAIGRNFQHQEYDYVIILKKYFDRWRLERPEVVEYMNNVYEIYSYCFRKVLTSVDDKLQKEIGIS